MITYVDTSTLIKLLVEESGTDRAAQIWESADSLASVSLIEVEARAALAAATRSHRLSPAAHRKSKAGLVDLIEQVDMIQVTHSIVVASADIAESDGLRAYDAVHLTAAILVGADIFTSADSHLCAAASAHGIHVANPSDGS